MAKLLYIEASPRKDRSASIEVARLFLDTYSSLHRDDVVETLDVWKEDLPEFDGDALAAKYAVLGGADPTGKQAEAWRRVTAMCDRLKSADKLLIGTPMWNFSIPYRFKQFIDVVTQPGQTFSFSPEAGYRGLVTGRPAAVVYARGGGYPEGTGASAMDMQKPYVELWLRFIGFESIRTLLVEGTLGDPRIAGEAKAAAAAKAREMAKEF